MKLDLPFPPSLNRLFRTVLIGVCGQCRRRAHATLYKSQEYQDYATELKLALLEHSVEQGPLVQIAKPSEVALAAHFYRPQRRGDLDNLLKALLDLLTGHLYCDDSQIAELHAYRHDDKARPRVELEVTELPSNETAKPEVQPSLDLRDARSPEPWSELVKRLARPNVVTNREEPDEA